MPDVLPRRACCAALALALLGSAVRPLGAQEPAPPAAQEDLQDATLRARLGTMIGGLQFENTTLDEWTGLLMTLADVPLLATPRAREVERAKTALVGITVPRVTLRELLDILTTQTGLRWRIANGVVVIDVRDGAPRAVARETVFVAGALATNGPVPIQAGKTTVLELVARSGLLPTADLERAQLIRPHATDPLVLPIDVRSMILTGDTTYNVTLQAGDVLFVPRTPPENVPVAAVDVGHRVVFDVGGALLEKEPTEQLAWLETTQTVDARGRILVPYVGRLVVLGLSPDELEKLVARELARVLGVRVPLDAKVTAAAK